MGRDWPPDIEPGQWASADGSPVVDSGPWPRLTPK